MKPLFKLTIVICVLFSIFWGCSKNPTEPKNELPTCSITSPSNDESFERGSTITITANAQDTDGEILKVSFYVDGEEKGNDTSDPYSFEWQTLDESIGNHSIGIVAYDDVDLVQSSIVTINLEILTGSFTDSRDGKTYLTVKIGEQWWMSENLAYGSEKGSIDVESFYSIKGYLYNWESANSACPEGWHLPSDNEWSVLFSYLGGKSVAGGKMKSTSGWNSPNEGATNWSGFSALPGGFASISGSNIFLRNKNVGTHYWSSNGKAQTLSFDNERVTTETPSLSYFLSVRCIKDD